MAEDLHHRVMQLLKEERQAISVSAFDRLTSLGQTKSTLFNMILAADLDPVEMQEIRTDLDRNQTLLSAAIEGVAAARSRLNALQEVRDGLNVYDQSGQMAKVPSVKNSLEKKA